MSGMPICGREQRPQPVAQGPPGRDPKYNAHEVRTPMPAKPPSAATCRVEKPRVFNRARSRRRRRTEVDQRVADQGGAKKSQ